MKKSVIFISISLVLIILLGMGVSYSMWNISVSQDTNNTAYTECFDLSITNKENNISLNNAYPISNDKGKSLTPYTFTITNTCDITTEYSVNLEVLNNSTFSSKFIDVMFEGNINLLSSYDTTDKVNTSSIESRKLTTGILKSQESKDYSLRLWLDYNTTLEDLNNEIKSFKSKIVVVGKPINYEGDTVFNFDYTGSEQTFIAPVSGTYRLETWGAQGGYGITGSIITQGGYGGYSVGTTIFNKGETVYLSVGQVGVEGNEEYTSSTERKQLRSSYNGGGFGMVVVDCNWGGGGGATHVATKPGLLSTLENYKSKILNVAGGGGGSGMCVKINLYDYQYGGAAGGYIGNSVNGSCADNAPTGGTQISGGIEHHNTISGAFGQGGSNGAGGGGGYYGGSAGWNCGSGAGGGSGYIGNSLLKNKVMYCYNCEESNEEITKTISTTCNEETPTSYCAKKGNGYARITLVSID